jgi:hypothetical protein
MSIVVHVVVVFRVSTACSEIKKINFGGTAFRMIKLGSGG